MTMIVLRGRVIVVVASSRRPLVTFRGTARRQRVPESLILFFFSSPAVSVPGDPDVVLAVYNKDK